MDADGGNQRNLTNNPVNDKDPSWSPDGEHIAFVSVRGEGLEIYVMDADGGNQQISPIMAFTTKIRHGLPTVSTLRLIPSGVEAWTST